ncbi:MAG: amino acid ABC transporter substrate-binding protein [Clostridiales bacterium]|nr:amino acid ABC transporter substrate-binding protein [Clostridiales bacterium]MDY4060238.1 amino acid ABC transporter substrate-binding protein [Anaerovoracaceae bacterium]
MKKRIIAVLTLGVILTTMVFLASCGNKDDGKKVDDKDLNLGTEGVFTVGLDDTFAPMGFRDKDGNLVGFDIDLATEVAKDMGLKVEFKPINWDAKDMELKSKNIDCVWNGMSQTPEREKAMSLSKKYLNNKIILMTNKDDIKVDASKDLKGLSIGTQADSSALEMLKKNDMYDEIKDKITEYTSYDDAILDMKAGRIDVIAIDQVLGEYKNNNMGEKMRSLKYDLGDDFYVIGFRKDDKALRDRVNAAIKNVIESGKAAEISKDWFGKDIVVFK